MFVINLNFNRVKTGDKGQEEMQEKAANGWESSLCWSLFTSRMWQTNLRTILILSQKCELREKLQQ